MNKISEADLILNPDGSVYHLGILPENLADIVITVGDPERVAKVSAYFDKIEFQHQKREINTHTGWLGSKRLTCISTGMGTDNIEIVLTELDALVNINLKERTVKDVVKSLNIIRIGTSGALQPEIPLDAHLKTELGIGIDALGAFYPFLMTNDSQNLCNKLQDNLGLELKPYATLASSQLFEAFQDNFVSGTTLTCPGFYAPQGRIGRFQNKHSNLVEQYMRFDFQGRKITNFEMETSGIYALGNLLGHKVLSLNAIVAQRAEGKFSKNPEKSIQKLIEKTLEGISKM